MLRAGQVDVALVFRHHAAGPRSGDRATARLIPAHGTRTQRGEPGRPRIARARRAGPPGHPAGRSRAAARAAGPAWRGSPPTRTAAGSPAASAAGSYLIRLCRAAGFSPDIAVTTDDYVAAQALVAAGLGVTILPGLALRAARHPGDRGDRTARRPRQVLAVTYGQPPDRPAASALCSPRWRRSARTVRRRATAQTAVSPPRVRDTP